MAVQPAWEAHYLLIAALSQSIALRSMATVLQAVRAVLLPSLQRPQALAATPTLQDSFPSLPQAAQVK